jgi:transcriptional repressor NrdR
MKCNHCACIDTKVIESRDVTDGQSIRRRRMCPSCGFRFTTYERLERPQLVVIKNDGTRELFNRAKLLAGLYRACEKTLVSSMQLEQIVSNIEEVLYGCSDPEVPSSKIGELVMTQLASINEVAYVRFASVYRRFTDIDGFEQALTNIKQQRVQEPELVKE